MTEATLTCLESLNQRAAGCGGVEEVGAIRVTLGMVSILAKQMAGIAPRPMKTAPLYTRLS